ncbi:MAG: hypothetical protein K0Q50_671 [Vampirovibrio sp.]|nr:hypothetical protein [Vampirovibrio sp.]
MYSAAAISNIGYYALKKKSGLHNRGFIPRRELFDLDLGSEFPDEALQAAEFRYDMEEANNGAASAGAFQEYKTQGG